MIDEYLIYLQERALISRKTISIDLDKFISGESNKLLIAGLSGAGKSTLCQYLAKKYKVEGVLTDKCIHFIKHPNKHIGAHNPSEDILKEVFLEGYVNCVRPELKKNKRQVIEGGFVWQSYLYFPQYRKEMKHHPIIIFGASALKASWQVFGRSRKKHSLPYAIGKIPLIYDRNFNTLNKKMDMFRDLRTKAGGDIQEFKVPKL